MTSHPRRIFACWLPLAAAALLLASPAPAEDITWSSANFVVNLDSNGNPLDDSYSFYLGIFDPTAEWAPDATNTAQWADYWITVDLTPYELGPNPGFSDGYDVEGSVDGVSLTGQQGYIWGVNRSCPGQWILVTNPAWTFPAPGFVFPQTWTISAGTAVVGAVNESGVHLRTAQVTDGLPPLLTPERWRQLYFTADELANHEPTVSGWLADPNNNGRVNLIEYALAGNPRSPLTLRRPVLSSTDSGGSNYLTLLTTRDPHAEVALSAEVGSDLEDWSGDPSAVVLEREASCEVVFRDLTAAGPGTPQRFIRLRATLTP